MLSPTLGKSGPHVGNDVGELEGVGTSVGSEVGRLVAGIEVGSLVVGSEVDGAWLVGDDVAGAEELGAMVGADETGETVVQTLTHVSMLQKLNWQFDAMDCHAIVFVPAAMLAM